jgi:sialic acid synthase SpsE
MTYIIAEVGINHNGNLNLAKKLILAAKNSGANAVKFQSFLPEEVVIKKLDLAP